MVITIHIPQKHNSQKHTCEGRKLFMTAVLKAPKINKNMPKQIQISSVPEYDNILILTNPRIRSQIETSPVCVKTHFSFSSPPIERSIETCPEIFKPGANVPNTL